MLCLFSNMNCDVIMKNHYQENLKKSAKRHHRNQRNLNFIQGVLNDHLYGATPSSSLSWWDDVDFILNDYRVIVAWIHPRQDFKDHIQAEARAAVAHLMPKGDWFDSAVADYMKVGKSRKKLIGHSVPLTEHSTERIQTYQEALKSIACNTQYSAKPSIRSEWLKHGYFVSACLPIEVHGLNDLLTLVSMVKRLLKGETTLAAEYPDYQYSKEQWMAEDNQRVIE